MKRVQKYFVLPVLLWGVLSACSSKPAEQASPAPAADVRPPQHEEMVQRGSNETPVTPSAPGSMTIPSGQAIHIRTEEAVDSDKAQPGQTFRAKLSEPIKMNGQLIVPLGTRATLLLSKADRGDLELRLSSVMYHGQPVHVSTVRAVPGKSIKIESGTEMEFQTAAPLVLAP